MHLKLRTVAGTEPSIMPFNQSQQILPCFTPHYKFHPALTWQYQYVYSVLAKIHFFTLIQMLWYTSEGYNVPWHKGRGSLLNEDGDQDCPHTQCLAAKISITEQSSDFSRTLHLKYRL